MAKKALKFDPDALDLIDNLVQAARNSQYRDTCASSCATGRDIQKSDQARNKQDEARQALIAHLGLEPC